MTKYRAAFTSLTALLVALTGSACTKQEAVAEPEPLSDISILDSNDIEVAHYEIAGRTVKEFLNTQTGKAHIFMATPDEKKPYIGYHFRAVAITPGTPQLISDDGNTIVFQPAINQGMVCSFEKASTPLNPEELYNKEGLSEMGHRVIRKLPTTHCG